MKGAGKRILITLLLLLLFCSFSFPCFAASGGYEYLDKDSYYSGQDNEDKKLIFFPLLPEDRISDNYLIFYYPKEEVYYLFFNTRDDFYYYRSYGWFGNFGVNYFYTYDPEGVNNWEFAFSCKGTDTHYRFSGLKVIDCTKYVENTDFNDGVDRIYTARTGYKLYWQLAYIEKSVLNWLDYYANYVLINEWLRYSFLVFFAGEVFVFVFLVVKRIGDFKQ